MKNSYLMSGIAVVTLMASLSGAAANAASTPGNNTAPNTPAAQSQLERPSAPLGNTNLEARFAALEAAMHDAQKRATQPASANNPPPASSGWWSNTSISGRMYYDVTDIENRANGVRVPGGGNGVNFDIKRFYIGIDHTFNGMFSANVTTDVTYDSGSSAGQIYLKKAYL
jgi:hypothetical protein